MLMIRELKVIFIRACKRTLVAHLGKLKWWFVLVLLSTNPRLFVQSADNAIRRQTRTQSLFMCFGEREDWTLGWIKTRVVTWKRLFL